MVVFELDMQVWMPHQEDGFIPVKMVKQTGDVILARAATGDQYELSTKSEYLVVHPSSMKPVEDMTLMEELSEAAILHNLRLRFDEDLIYTHISSILVSINPFKPLPIYSSLIMAEYRVRCAKMEQIAPHVYALADNAYKNLRTDNENQSVIISGESGAGQHQAARAQTDRPCMHVGELNGEGSHCSRIPIAASLSLLSGKTEATKLVLQYMAECSGQGNDVEQQILSSNPMSASQHTHSRARLIV